MKLGREQVLIFISLIIIFSKSVESKKRGQGDSAEELLYYNVYKSKFKDGISELKHITTSENRLWLKLEKKYFGLEKDLFICACYVPPVSSTYFDDDFTKIENEISFLYDQGNIILIGDLNARISDRADFIENETDSRDNLQNILPDKYNEDRHIHRNCIDRTFNTQGQALVDLCISSQLRIMNGRFICDYFGNFTCHKPYGSSTVDSDLTNMDFINSINFFQVHNPTYLSDHSQISMHINCHINSTKNCNKSNFKAIEYTYKWEPISKDKLLQVLHDTELIQEIVNFENHKFEDDCNEVDRATEHLTNIFENLSRKSCKYIRNKKIKPKRKKPWADTEIKDLKKNGG